MSGAVRERRAAQPPAGGEEAAPGAALRAGPIETIALAALPVAWLWSTQEVLGQAWLWHVLGAVGSMALVAWLVRLVWPAFAATAAAALVGTGWVTAVAASDAALLGVIPTPEAADATMAALAEGVQSIAWALATPVPFEAPVLAAVVAAAVALAVLVDLLGHGLRTPALAVLASAATLALPIAFRLDAPWWHALPGAVASALALAAPAIDDRLRRGRGWAAPVALVAAAAVLAAAVPLVAPDPRSSSLDLPGLDELLQPATPVLSAEIDLGDELRRPEARPVFTYSTTDGQPMLTRLMTLPEAGADGFLALPPEASAPSPLVEGAELGTAVQMAVRMSEVRAEALPTPERVAGVEAPEDARWDDANDALRIGGSFETAGLEYAAAGSRSTALAELPSSAASTGHDEYLALPEGAAAIGRQGAALVEPQMSATERIRAVHAFMTEGVWDYSEQLDLPGFGGAGGDGWTALEGFLETRSGYCVHYASATATLLRGAGVPTRVAVGFLPGSEISGGFAVSTNDMHAWAEAWVDSAGWVRVETTPGASTGDDAPSPEDGTQTQEPTAEPAPAAPTEAEPSGSPTPSASPGSGTLEPGEDEGPGTEPGAGGVDPAMLRAWLLWLGALLLLALPWAVRRGLRAARLGRGAPGAWRELRAALADAGVRLPGSATPGDVQAAIAARVPPEPAAAADRVRLAAERAVFAGGSREPGECDADVALVRRALVASLRPPRRVLAVLLPASLLRIDARP